MKLFRRTKKAGQPKNHWSALFSSAIAEGVKDAFAEMGYTRAKTSTQNRADSASELEKIANCMATHFAKSLFSFSEERNYYVYAGCLHEINDWAGEFYEEYYLNSDYTPTWDEDFLVEWGHARMQQFIDQRSHKKAEPLLSI